MSSLWDLIFAFQRKEGFDHSFFGMVIAYDLVSMFEALVLCLLLSLHGKYYYKSTANKAKNKVVAQ